MSRLGNFGARLYRGQVSYDFVGRRRIWYAVSAVVLALSIGAIAVRGLTLGIEFRGGGEFTVPGGQCTVATARDAVSGTGLGGELRAQQVGGDRIRVQTGALSTEDSERVKSTLARACGVDEGQVSSGFVGPSWGADVSKKALQALGVFLLAVALFLSVYFEWKMAVAALVALLHDLLITVGIYALVGFEVTPATVIGLLTILGYSLYDTVVVFDKVKENTTGIGGSNRLTYSDAANLAVNQTLVRSINTSVIALLPVAGLLFIGAGLLGAGTLKDLALALFIGIATGAYSSIFVATPLLAGLKEREPGMQALARRVAARRAAGRPAPATRAGATALAVAEESDGGLPTDRGGERPGSGGGVTGAGGRTVAAEPAAIGAAGGAPAPGSEQVHRPQRQQPRTPRGSRSAPRRSTPSRGSNGRRRR